MLVSASQYGGDLGNGCVYILNDPLAGGSLDTAIKIIGGERDFLGTELSIVGDMSGTGAQSVAINAYRAEGLSGTVNAGVTYVFDQLPEQDSSPYTADHIIEGVVEVGQSGNSIAPAGDVNGDGADDILQLSLHPSRRWAL